jgi:alkylation response protein AidB-like acyl-CoA dehydrogenase
LPGLAADFATRSAQHDRDASHPRRTIAADRRGFPGAERAGEWGGAGVGLLGHTFAFEALGQGCPSTASPSTCTPRWSCRCCESPEVGTGKAASRRPRGAAEKLIGGNFSEAGTTSLIGERPLSARARRVDGGYSVTGRKMFASMLEAADLLHGAGLSRRRDAALAGILCWCRGADGPRRRPNWDVLGMRATRSDSLILEDCRCRTAPWCSAATISGRSGTPPQLVLGLLHGGVSRRRGGGL